jgi:enamine deaminase RidA (YjgF/YER057c/UK114 family)
LEPKDPFYVCNPCPSLQFTISYLLTLSQSAGGAWTSKGIVFTSGTVPSLNGSIVEGGIGPQTVIPHHHPSTTILPPFLFSDGSQAQVIKNIAVILGEAGTSWEYVMKTTVYLANMSDYAAMNEVYG